MEIRLLGPVEVVGDHGLVDLGGARQARLLVALATAQGRRLTLDELWIVVSTIEIGQRIRFRRSALLYVESGGH